MYLGPSAVSPYLMSTADQNEASAGAAGNAAASVNAPVDLTVDEAPSQKTPAGESKARASDGPPEIVVC